MEKAYQNVQKWRSLSQNERRMIGHKNAVKYVSTSMAMEGEPVSAEWLKKNAR